MGGYNDLQQSTKEIDLRSRTRNVLNKPLSKDLINDIPIILTIHSITYVLYFDI